MSDTPIKDRPVQIFLDELASKASTPGGGSAAAIMGAMGAALVSMVCNFTVGKKGYEAVDAAMRETLAKAENLRDRMTAMVKADVDVFNQVMAAYALPKDTDAQKAARTGAIQTALKAATDVPLACAKAAAEAIDLSRAAAAMGNKNVISDAGVAVLAAYAALRSAALNVLINVGGIKDEMFSKDRLAQLDAVLKSKDVAMEDIYRTVKDKL